MRKCGKIVECDQPSISGQAYNVEMTRTQASCASLTHSCVVVRLGLTKRLLTGRSRRARAPLAIDLLQGAPRWRRRPMSALRPLSGVIRTFASSRPGGRFCPNRTSAVTAMQWLEATRPSQSAIVPPLRCLGLDHEAARIYLAARRRGLWRHMRSGRQCR
jgi:hypothetical protein